MKKLNIFIFVLSLIVITQVNAIHDYDYKDTMMEYETKIVNNDGIDYELEAVAIANDEVIMKINGEVTDKLGVSNTPFMLEDGSEFYVLDIIPNEGTESGGGDVVEFGMNFNFEINYSLKCYDKDEGKNYYVKGKIYNLDSNGNAINPNYDVCYDKNKYDSDDIPDECFTPGMCLMETYCGDDNSYQNIVVFCEYGCEDGACRKTAPDCVDSDGGENYFEYGEASSGNKGTFDTCYYVKGNNILHEAICDNEGDVGHVEVKCPSDKPYCNRAVCSKYPPECTDSDGGKNFEKEGTLITDKLVDGYKMVDYCESMKTKQPTDYCEGDDCAIREYYCSNDYTFSYVDQACKKCKNGECIVKDEDEDNDDDENEYYYDDVETDFKDYPKFFFKNEKLNAKIVVGDMAPSIDVLSALDIATSLKTYAMDKGYPDETIKAYLVSDISDPLSENLIVVGNPCNNEIAAELLGAGSDCDEDFNDNEGRLQIFENNGKIQVLVAGKEGETTKKASEKLAGFDNYYLHGSLMIVKGNSLIVPDTEGSKIESDDDLEDEITEKVEDSETENGSDEIKKEEKNVSDTVVVQPCNGCESGTFCLPYGTRKKIEGISSYCSINNTFSPQKENDNFCQNDFECVSNQCIDGKCGSLKEQLEETQGMLQRFIDWITKFFG